MPWAKDYILGEIPIGAIVNIECNQKDTVPSTAVPFVDEKLNTGSTERILFHFSFAKDKKCYQDDKKIYSDDARVRLIKTVSGELNLFSLCKNEIDILWNLSLNSEFTHFEYRLTQHQATQSDDFFQLIFNRFLLQHTFINHHGLIIHAAGGSINGKGMVFPAISGTGKSTLSHLLLPYPENQLFSEERIIMRRLDDGWHLWGTPWKGSGVIARNESAPLSALVFLSQATETKISKLPTSAALRRLLETVSIPWYSQEWTDKGLAVCESLLRAIPAYELAFRPDQTAVQAVAELAASLD